MWCCLYNYGLFFALPYTRYSLSLLAVLLSSLLGCLFFLIYFILFVKWKFVVAIIVFLLCLISKTDYLGYFAGSLIPFVLVMLPFELWIIIGQTALISVSFGFVTQLLNVWITGKNIN